MMNFELKRPILVVGAGDVGSKLTIKASKVLGADCLCISNDQKDWGEKSIKIDTCTIVNPSSQAIRGFALESSEEIREQISGYSSIVMMANLAGRSGAAIAPIVSSICKEESKNLISFAIMPFKYESDRIFASGVSLKRVRSDSACTVIVDNDAMLESNPDLTAKSCYTIANSAILHMAESLKSDQIPSDTNVLSVSKERQDVEVSLRDSLKMLHENAPSNVKRSIIHVLGGDNIPVGMMRMISRLAQNTVNSASVNMSSVESETPGIVMLSTVQGQTKFDDYDPLGCIPMSDTIDWDTLDCSYDCKLDMYQLE